MNKELINFDEDKNEEVESNNPTQEILIWTNMGRTLFFKNVINFKYHTQGFEFDYKGVSTGKNRHANFNNTSVVGYALK
jgi:hypothetical protein